MGSGEQHTWGTLRREGERNVGRSGQGEHHDALGASKRGRTARCDGSSLPAARDEQHEGAQPLAQRAPHGHPPCSRLRFCPAMAPSAQSCRMHMSAPIAVNRSEPATFGSDIRVRSLLSVISLCHLSYGVLCRLLRLQRANFRGGGRGGGGKGSRGGGSRGRGSRRLVRHRCVAR